MILKGNSNRILGFIFYLMKNKAMDYINDSKSFKITLTLSLFNKKILKKCIHIKPNKKKKKSEENTIFFFNK